MAEIRGPGVTIPRRAGAGVGLPADGDNYPQSLDRAERGADEKAFTLSRDVQHAFLQRQMRTATFEAPLEAKMRADEVSPPTILAYRAQLKARKEEERRPTTTT